MSLPNPFATSSVSKSITVSIPPQKNYTLNPGPGLPKVLKTHFFNKHSSDQSSNNFTNEGFVSRSSKFQSHQFSCDRCDRSFASQELLNSHISEHVSCGINGCTFLAHPKIVERHIKLQHDTGLAEQIMRLNTPEEIQKWREQRKKNFPTSANVAQRQAEQKEKLERGEVLYGTKKKNVRKQRPNPCKKWDARVGRTKNVRNNHKRNMSERPVDSTVQSNTLLVSPAANELHTIKTAAAPLCSKKNRKDLSDGEIESDVEQPGVIHNISSSGALASLIDYESDEKDLEGTEKDKVVEETVKKEIEEKNISAPVDVSTEKIKKRATKRKRKGNGVKSSNPTPQQSIRPKRLTLLQQLLQGEIRHERNVIMQCVYYIVQQNFFGIGTQQSSTASKDF